MKKDGLFAVFFFVLWQDLQIIHKNMQILHLKGERDPRSVIRLVLARGNSCFLQCFLSFKNIAINLLQHAVAMFALSEKVYRLPLPIIRKAVRYMPANRDKQGRFVKGQSGNPKGRPSLPKEIKEYASEAPKRLREIADDKATPVRLKAEIEKWFAEMYYGKSAQQVTLDGEVSNTGTTTIKFEGELEEWAK